MVTFNRFGAPVPLKINAPSRSGHELSGWKNMPARPNEPGVPDMQKRTSFQVMRNVSGRPDEAEVIDMEKRVKKRFTVDMAMFADYSIYRR